MSAIKRKRDLSFFSLLPGLLAMIVHADTQQEAIIHTPTINYQQSSSPPKAILQTDPRWEELGSVNFRSSANQATIKVQAPQKYKQIKLISSKQLKITGLVLTKPDNQKTRVQYQSVPLTLKGRVTYLPDNFQLLQKVTVNYKNPKKEQGVITLFGYNDSQH